MSKLVAIMSMSLDGYVADRNDGVDEVFDWYVSSGDVEIHTAGSDPMTFKVSGPSAEHIRGSCSTSVQWQTSFIFVMLDGFCILA